MLKGLGKMSAVFGPSLYNVPVVIHEEPVIVWRILEVLLVVAFSIGASVYVERMARCLSLTTRALLHANNMAAMLHYADNIWRPVAYAEPEWLYAPHYIVPMDATTSYGLALALCTVLCAWLLAQWTRVATGEVYWKCGWVALGCHALWGTLSIAHFVVQSCWWYRWDTWITIVGEPIVSAATIAVVVAVLSNSVGDDKFRAAPRRAP